MPPRREPANVAPVSLQDIPASAGKFCFIGDSVMHRLAHHVEGHIATIAAQNGVAMSVQAMMRCCLPGAPTEKIVANIVDVKKQAFKAKVKKECSNVRTILLNGGLNDGEVNFLSGDLMARHIYTRLIAPLKTCFDVIEPNAARQWYFLVPQTSISTQLFVTEFVHTLQGLVSENVHLFTYSDCGHTERSFWVDNLHLTSEGMDLLWQKIVSLVTSVEMKRLAEEATAAANPLSRHPQPTSHCIVSTSYYLDQIIVGPRGRRRSVTVARPHAAAAAIEPAENVAEEVAAAAIEPAAENVAEEAAMKPAEKEDYVNVTELGEGSLNLTDNFTKDLESQTNESMKHLECDAVAEGVKAELAQLRDEHHQVESQLCDAKTKAELNERKINEYRSAVMNDAAEWNATASAANASLWLQHEKMQVELRRAVEDFEAQRFVLKSKIERIESELMNAPSKKRKREIEGAYNTFVLSNNQFRDCVQRLFLDKMRLKQALSAHLPA